MSLASGRVEGETPFSLCWVVAISVVKFELDQPEVCRISARCSDFARCVCEKEDVNQDGAQQESTSSSMAGEMFVACFKLYTSWGCGNTDSTPYRTHHHRSRQVDKTRSAYPHASRFDRPQLQSPLLAAMWSYMIFEGLS
jgi:hypothetical protein